MDKITGGRCQASYATREYHHTWKDTQYSAIMYGMETVPMTSSHMKKLEVTDMKMCRWTCGHTIRDHVRDEAVREINNL